jgi:hypothetical protein
MPNRIILLNTIEFPCPGSHLLHAKKLLSSFETQGLEFGEIGPSQSDELIELGHGDIVYISDHGLSTSGPSQLQIEALERLAKQGVFPIFWFWHKYCDLLTGIFGDRWILTGEHLRSKIVLPSHSEYSSISAASPNFVPSRFASSLRASEIGATPRKVLHNASFVGHRYQRQLNRKLQLTLPKVKVVYTPPFISEQFRISLFTGSHIVLGWHSGPNISNGNVVERVFEGLAFGSVVITDNPFALEATDGNVLFADTYAQTKEYFQRVIGDDKFRSSLQANGVAWAKAHGTYESVAASFVERINSL